MKLGAVAIAAGIVIVSASLAFVLFALAGLSPVAAAASGICAGAVLALSQLRGARSDQRALLAGALAKAEAEQRALHDEIMAVRSELPALTEAARRAEAAERSVGALLDEALGPALDQRIARQFDAGKATLVGEMRVIEGLVKQLVETPPKPKAPEAAPAIPASAPKVALRAANETQALPPEQVGAADEAADAAELLARVRHAIADNRIDIYLQPIVSLPQRKVRYYEALVRLRDAGGDPIMPQDYLEVATAAGLMPVLDNLLLLRSTQIVKQMTRRNKQFRMFCNLSLETLGDPDHFPQFIDYLEHNRDLQDHLVFEIGQASLKKAGPLELDSLAALFEQGYRFSLDHVDALDLDARELSQRGFKFIKIAANLLLDGGLTVKTHIHPADMSSLLARYGMELIAERVETETEVVNLLDLDLSLGQGYLFAEPKQVRIGNANLQDLLAQRKAS